MNIVEEKTIETPSVNPTGFGKELATDFVGFGLGAAGTHLGLEYATTEGMKGITAKADKVNWGVGIGVLKWVAGTAIFALASKYIEKPNIVKKLGYGVGAGFFTSGATDFVDAYNTSIAP